MKIDNMLSDAELTKACRQLRSYKVQQYRSFENSVGFENSKVDAAVKRTIHRYEILQQLKKWWINLITIGVSFSLLGSTIAYSNPDSLKDPLNSVRFATDKTIIYNSARNPIHGLSFNVACELEWLPEGFSLTQTDEYHIYGEYLVYKNDCGDVITFTYCAMDSFGRLEYSSRETLKTEQDIYEDFEYEFIYADCDSPLNNLIAMNADKNLLVTIDSTLDKDAIFKMFYNMKINSIE